MSRAEPSTVGHIARILLALAGATLASCSSSSDTSSVTYSLYFPSLAAAVATDSVKVIVFDATADDTCQTVFRKRTSGDAKNLPAVIAEGREERLCDVLADPAGAHFTSSYGRRAVLAVGLRATAANPKEDFLIGCTEIQLSKDTQDIAIALTLPDLNRQPPAPTTCTSLGQSCAKKCP